MLLIGGGIRMPVTVVPTPVRYVLLNVIAKAEQLLGKKYEADSIQILEGLEAVRKRPGMYIGSTDGRGLHHLIWEIVDNAIDEALNGYGNKITITLKTDGSCMVEDEGRGMPVGSEPGWNAGWGFSYRGRYRFEKGIPWGCRAPCQPGFP